MKPRVVFLDRDGVLNEDLEGGVTRWEDFRFVPGALEAVARLTRAKLPVYIITNQANVGRGRVARSVIEDIHARMLAAITAAGGAIAGLYVCFHGPDDGCACRKPEPGLLLQAAKEHGLTLADTVFVGDDLRDLDAALRAGAKPSLVLTGKGRKVRAEAASRTSMIDDDLAAFARRVVPD